MQRSDLIALRERVTTKGGFPKLLAAIDLMLLHHEPGYEHELHPAVRHYRVLSHVARTLSVAAATAEPLEKAQVERNCQHAYFLARQGWDHLERHHPELAARVMAGPNSYKALGITPPLPDLPAEPASPRRPERPRPVAAPVSRADVSDFVQAMARGHHMGLLARAAADMANEAEAHERQRPTLRSRIDARIIRSQAGQLAECQRAWHRYAHDALNFSGRKKNSCRGRPTSTQ